MRSIKLTLAYDGTAYAGWQYQPDRLSVQEVLQRAIESVTGVAARPLASGRTDAGVHALRQVAGFRTECRLPPAVLKRALNANLPADVAVLDVDEAPDNFHPIRDVLRKRYRYVIQDGRERDIFRRAYCWQIGIPLDETAMQRAAAALVGTHDFASFQTAGAERATTVRTIYDLAVRRADVINIEVEADGFLYNMVRTIVGTLVEVGRGARGESWPGEVLQACNRRRAAATAPPQGLFLVAVTYREEEGQRDKGTEGQRDKGTEGQRDKGTEGQRDKGTEVPGTTTKISQG
jgi:tRNA pseudouridine38-40 synthase